MSSQLINGIISQARDLSGKDLETFCSGLITALHTHNASDCQGALRQLFLLLHSSQNVISIPQQLTDGLVRVLLLPDKSQWPLKHLSSSILEEMAPSDNINLPLENVPWSESQVPYVVPVALNQGAAKTELLQYLVPQLVRWLSTVGFPLEVQAVSLAAVGRILATHPHLLHKEHEHVVSSQLVEWLRNASILQASNPYSRNLFKKEGDQSPVTEIDGAVTKNFFTILCLGQYYSADQLLNVYSFSLLRQWLVHAEMPSGCDSGSLSRLSLASLSSVDSFQSVSSKCDPVTEAALQYALRIIDQCDRKPKVAQDTEVMMASLVESVCVLDRLCQRDSRLVPRVFDNVKRLYSRTTPSQPRVLLAVMQFFLNHSEAVVYDAFQLYELYFGKVVSTYYTNNAVAFDTVMFLQDNLATLCYRTSLLSKYFPNLLKIVAWNPRTYVSEFVEILPAFMSPSTVLEVFHSLLDLPCLTAALQLSQHGPRHHGYDSSLLLQLPAVFSIPAKTVSDFTNPMYVPLFNFIMRMEGGFGDTINKLGTVHLLLQDMASHPRVVVCADAVPSLLRVFFNHILEEGDLDLANNMVPVLLERSGLLYNIPVYKQQIRRLLADYLVSLLRKYPCLVMEQYSEILDFISSIRNITDREDFFVHVIWVLGEYLVTTYDGRCTPDVVSAVYEQLETLAYELHGVIHSISDPTRGRYSPRLMTVLMTALAKLASRSQDLIPRVMLCLAKLGQLPPGGVLDAADKQAVADRATELLSLMKLPNIAAVILSPDPEINSGRWHTDNSSLPVLLQTTKNLLQSRLQ